MQARNQSELPSPILCFGKQYSHRVCLSQWPATTLNCSWKSRSKIFSMFVHEVLQQGSTHETRKKPCWSFHIQTSTFFKRSFRPADFHLGCLQADFWQVVQLTYSQKTLRHQVLWLAYTPGNSGSKYKCSEDSGVLHSELLVWSDQILLI